MTNRINLVHAYDKSKRIVFKGQMKLVKELGLVLFVAHPMLVIFLYDRLLKSIIKMNLFVFTISINRMEDMPDLGIYLNDLNNYDSSVEILVNEMQTNFESGNSRNQVDNF